jgi:hypothetical protein
MRNIRPKHECHNDSWQITFRLWRRVLECVVCFIKSWRSVYFAMHSDLPMLIRRFPKHLIGLQMELRAGVWVGNSFFDYFYEGPVVELSANKLAGARVLHSAVERYLYLHMLCPPPSIHIQPLFRDLTWVAVHKLGKDRVPLRMSDIL